MPGTGHKQPFPNGGFAVTCRRMESGDADSRLDYDSRNARVKRNGSAPGIDLERTAGVATVGKPRRILACAEGRFQQNPRSTNVAMAG
jgi:hypothetical protein